MDLLTLFGLFSVTLMLICYSFENRNHWFILGLSFACVLGSIYGFLQGAWPFVSHASYGLNVLSVKYTALR